MAGAFAGFIKEFKQTLSYCGKEKRYYVIVLTAVLIADVVDVFSPKLIEHGVNAVAGEGHATFLSSILPESWFAEGAAYGGAWIYGLAYFLLIVGIAPLRFLMSIYISRASMNIAHDTRNRLYSTVQNLPATWHDQATTGKIMSLATNDMDACRFFWGIGILLTADTIFYLVLTPALMFSVSWELTLACLVMVIPMPWVVARIAHRIETNFEEVQESFSVLSDQASESFHGAKVVKSFAAEDQEVERYRELSKGYQKRSLRLAFWQRLEDPTLMLFIGLMQIMVLGYGGYMVSQGTLNVGEFFAFFFYLLRLAFPMMELGFVITLYQRCVVSRRRIEEVLHANIAIQSKPGAIAPESAHGALEFRDLTFAYEGADRNALENISLKIPAGSSVAFMGEVGAGKSTILGLVARLYDPPEGSLYFDDAKIHDLPLDWLRNQMASVPQETFLFSETIIENIGFGAAAADQSEEELKGFAKIARIHDDILEFPKGYKTMLGEKGVNLSGGQKQRIAIARALACRPKVLVLDDCLSAVDALTEAAIFESLGKELGQCTSLIASHRVSAVRRADLIVVLEKGRVIEQGTHKELLAKDGWYADLNRKQSLAAAIDDA